MKKIFVIILLLLHGLLALAQSGQNSFVTHNGHFIVTENSYEVVYSESYYIGPNADLEINGELVIYSKNVWIAPGAKIHGTGKIIINDPGSNPMYNNQSNWTSQTTVVDGNNNQEWLGVTVVIANAKGITLDNISEPGFPGFVEPDDVKSAALRLGKALDLSVDGANVFLNGHDFELDTGSDILNANINRMVVTGNKTKGHMIKNFLGVSAFTFPVGIEAQDYTPATLTPSTAGRKVYVTVTDYSQSSINFDQKEIDFGMDRVWNIFADESLTMTYRLRHNMTTNGIAYIDALVQIVQNADGGNWIGDITSIEGDGIHTRDDIITHTGNTISGTWFTKFSAANDEIGPIAQDDTATLDKGRDITIDVLANDLEGNSPIIVGSVTIIKQPEHGRVVVNPDGSVTYTPNSPSFVGTDTFEYRITDEEGLTDTATVTIVVLPRELKIPNVITPNGDGYNDFFVIEGIELYDRIDLVVINRFGNEVYRNENYNNQWDGAGVNEGTYFTLITAYRGSDVRVFKKDLLIKRN